MDSNLKELWQGTRFYVLWFISCAIGFVNFAVALNTLRFLAVIMGADQWSLPAIQRFTLLGLMVLLVIFFFWSEARYRKASYKSAGTLLRTFAWITGGQVLLLLILYVIPLLRVGG
ncbi:MAG: hypothetical protein HY328_06755 [Chloroflexi bacterium]|nr:hypothetical protein [Chloroflexota bacterium]